MIKTFDIEDFTGAYGPNWVRGMLIDNVPTALQFGAVAHTTASGSTWVTFGKAAAVRVVCGEIVPIYTEDGTISGRCGLPVVGQRGACEAHAEERDAWLASSEAERMEWERQNDRI